MNVNLVTVSLDADTRSSYRVTEYGDPRVSFYTRSIPTSLSIYADSPATIHKHFSSILQAIEASAVEATCQWILHVFGDSENESV